MLYLRFVASELGDLRNNHDASISYDGDANILTQQTSNWLIKCWKTFLVTEKPADAPLNSINFFSQAKQILNTKCVLTEWKADSNANPINVLLSILFKLIYFFRSDNHI